MSGETESGGRREFMSGLTLAGAASLLGMRPEPAAAAPAPEIKTVRFMTYPAACIAPQWVAEDLLRVEGFTEVNYVDASSHASTGRAVGTGKADFSMEAAPVIPTYLDAGESIVALSGIHTGCFELFGHADVRSVRDLKGKRISVTAENDERHVFVALMLAYVGLDPRRDVRWDFRASEEGMRLFADGKVDAFLGFPPDPQELRARKIGHVVVNTLTDRPWSNYFCCMLTANRDFARKHPVATKLVVRALIKAGQICASEPERVVRMLAGRGHERRSAYAVQVLKQLPYARWRDFSPDDTLRFYALRLHEIGMIKSSPQKLMAQGADWRFINELKKELKG
jgi:NitT/TauT family transport system substrate-binding protein